MSADRLIDRAPTGERRRHLALTVIYLWLRYFAFT